MASDCRTDRRPWSTTLVSVRECGSLPSPLLLSLKSRRLILITFIAYPQHIVDLPQLLHLPCSYPMAERGCRNLNDSVVRQISRVLDNDPTADLEQVLCKLYTSYARLRREVEERQLKRRAGELLVCTSLLITGAVVTTV